MLIVKQVDVRANIKKYFDLAFSGEAIVVPRKENKNVVIMSEKEYQELDKLRRNQEYLAKLERSREQIRSGHVVTKTMSELEELANA